MVPASQSMEKGSILECNQCDTHNCRSLVAYESMMEFSNPDIESSSENSLSLLLPENSNKDHEKCQQCDYKAASKAQLQSHKISVHEKHQYNCEQCNYKTSRKDHLQHHAKSVHEHLKFHCEQCDYRSSRKDHLQSHTKSVQYQTQISIRIFLKDIRFQKEIQQNENENTNKIVNEIQNTEENDDPLISTQEMIADARARRECTVKEFYCEQCEFKSSSKTLLNKHATINHKDKAINSLKMRKRFSCDNCEYKTTNENSLKAHVKTNHTKENYQSKILVEKVKSKRIHCNICDKNFNKPDTFNKHMKSAHNEHKKPNIQQVAGRSNSMNNNKLIETVFVM